MTDPDQNPWWATLPVDWNERKPRELRDILSHAYDERPSIKKVVIKVGLSWPNAPGGTASAHEIWTWAIEAAVGAGLLFDLHGLVIEDSTAAAFNNQLKSVFGGGLTTPIGTTRRLVDSRGDVESSAIESLRGATADVADGLQNVNLATVGFTDAVMFETVTRNARRRTAMIEIGSQPKGTGFLVGPNLLLTAAHVVDASHLPPQPSGDIVAVFDYEPQMGHAPSETGKRVCVIDPGVAGSLPTPEEIQNRVSDWNATTDRLDYALMRLETDMATQEVEGRTRGFFPLDAAKYKFIHEAVLQIFQHPLGQTLVRSPVLGSYELNPNQSRVRYRGNTLPGSSGSAVLDMRGRVVALHHFSSNGRNQGIPIDLIVQDMVAQGIHPAKPSHGEETGDADTSSSASSPNPFDTIRIGPRPFANRREFRTVVRKMLDGTAERILVIDGGPDAGKSYSYRYLTHLEAEKDHPKIQAVAPCGIRTVKIDLDEYVNIPRDELRAHITHRLCTVMSLLPPEALSQPARQVVNLVELLDAKLYGTDVVWWIFFDSLDRHVLEHGQVNELISELWDLIDLKKSLPLRLVLSSRSTDFLPEDLANYVERDMARGLSRDDVATWLKDCASENNKAIEDVTLISKLDELFKPVDSAPTARHLAPKLPGLLDELTGGEP